MITNEGQSYKERGASLRRKPCDLRASYFCESCSRWVCSIHRSSRHFGTHPLIYPGWAGGERG